MVTLIRDQIMVYQNLEERRISNATTYHCGIKMTLAERLLIKQQEEYWGWVYHTNLLNSSFAHSFFSILKSYFASLAKNKTFKLFIWCKFNIFLSLWYYFKISVNFSLLNINHCQKNWLFIFYEISSFNIFFIHNS